MEYKISFCKYANGSNYSLKIEFMDSDYSRVYIKNFIDEVKFKMKRSEIFNEIGLYIHFASFYSIENYRVYLPSVRDWVGDGKDVHNFIFKKYNYGSKLFYRLNNYLYSEDNIKILMEELHYFYNYIFKEIELVHEDFNLNDYFNHRNKLIKQDKSRVKLEYKDGYLDVIRFKYNKEERNIIVNKVLYNVSNVNKETVANLEKLKTPSIWKRRINDTDKSITNVLIESIREFESEKQI